MAINKNNVLNLFYIFLATHLIIWTAVPTLTNNNLPLDTIEALAWGSNLDWGFNKHPPMSAFLVEILYQLFGTKDWAYYLLSQICVVLSFFIIWNFSKEFLKNQSYSFLSILLLEGIYFYNYTTPEFNVYICELPFWALTILYCWKGFKNNKYKDWTLFGTFAAARRGWQTRQSRASRPRTHPPGQTRRADAASGTRPGCPSLVRTPSDRSRTPSVSDGHPRRHRTLDRTPRSSQCAGHSRAAAPSRRAERADVPSCRRQRDQGRGREGLDQA